MKKLLFFNRFPIIDDFVAKMISHKVSQITISRSVSDLKSHLESSHFHFVLMNVDDRLAETPCIVELVKGANEETGVAIFGQYKEHLPALEQIGGAIFLPEDPKAEDFTATFDRMEMIQHLQERKFA